MCTTLAPMIAKIIHDDEIDPFIRIYRTDKWMDEIALPGSSNNTNGFCEWPELALGIVASLVFPENTISETIARRFYFTFLVLILAIKIREEVIFKWTARIVESQFLVQSFDFL